MLRKYIAIIMIALAGAIAANAQSAVGSWYSFPVFSSTIDKVIDGKSKVFFTTAKRLYSIDKTTNEFYSWGLSNSLNDTNVSNIYYNPDKGVLLVAYDTSNIDIIDESTGRVYNLGDIKSSGLNMSKTINDVAFGNGRIYVATDFGLVIYNDSNYQVIESGIYNTPIKYVAETDGMIVINEGAKILVASVEGRHNSLDKFTIAHSSLGITSMDAINGGVIVYWDYGKSLYKFIIDPETLKNKEFTTVNVQLDSSRPIKNLNNEYVVYDNNKITTIDADGNVANTITLPQQLAGKVLGMGRGKESVWVGDYDGVGNVAIGDGNSLTVLAAQAKPRTFVPVSMPDDMAVSADGNYIYIKDGAWSFTHDYGGSASVPSTVVLFKDGEPIDVTPSGVIYDKGAAWTQTVPGKPASLSSISVDPRNPARYAMACTFENVYIVEDGEIVNRFNCDNAPFINWWMGGIISDLYFDEKGNLWVMQYDATANESSSSMLMLPAEKLNGQAQITASDWKTVPSMRQADSKGQLDGVMLNSKKAPDIMFHSYASNNSNLDYIDRSTMTWHRIYPVIDQDGKTLTFDQIQAMAEDAKGRIWMGTQSGVFEITDPSQVTNADFRVNHIKVPRNDGTNFADYLLDSENVYCIAVDGANRKWIGTQNSGLYLVSENGDKILENYTVENSDIPSNTVYSVMCDPNSNIIYVGTRNGLVTLGSSTAPAAPSFDDIYAYPNPVKPGYTGYITVRGLMDNSLVKIADSAGNVVAQGRSNGGLFVWDGNNSAGQRVSSGVYYVFASQNANDSSSAAVTKIVVIN